MTKLTLEINIPTDQVEELQDLIETTLRLEFPLLTWTSRLEQEVKAEPKNKPRPLKLLGGRWV